MNDPRREPEVALAFTPDPWVEDLHRHLTDHGGARVRAIVVEPAVALEETYDVLVAGHRWPALTRALVRDVRARGRVVLGVYDREEPASRRHLVALGVDAAVESDAGPDGFVRAIVDAAGRRDDRMPAPALGEAERVGRLAVVGGPPGVGRTEIAIQLAIGLTHSRSVTLLDADDVAPAVAQRLALPIDPNICTAIDAVEHGRGRLDEAVTVDSRAGIAVVVGVPSARAWTQVRPGEVIRVVDRLADGVDVVVADGAGCLEDVGAASPRGRYATARALIGEADVIVGTCDASPHGVTRLLGWVVEARELAPDTPMLAVVNRAPSERFRRGELFEELTGSAPLVDVVFAAADSRVGDAAWSGAPVAVGPFTRAVDRAADAVAALPRRRRRAPALEEAS